MVINLLLIDKIAETFGHEFEWTVVARTSRHPR